MQGKIVKTIIDTKISYLKARKTEATKKVKY